MFLYRVLLSLAAPIFLWRLWRRDDVGARQERLGGRAVGIARKDGVLWVHAASNGELTAARALIEALLARDGKLTVIVTCNSVTGRALAQGWGLERVQVRLAPLDFRLVLRRFIGNWQPDALIIIENELWPNRMAMMAGLGRPVVVLSARMSAGSARMWGRLPGLARKVMGTIRYLSAQDAASEVRFADLGVGAHCIGPVLNLKSSAAEPGAVDEDALDALAPLFPRDKTLLAASTHEGEDSPIIMGFRQAVAHDPERRMILAPRHPRRAGEIETILKRNRLSYAVRSRGEEPGPDTQVYLADTLGEMPLWYDLAGVCFVGGSLVDKGGHTPFEPAAHGAALLHGPHLSNFADVYAALEAAGGSRRIGGADDLAAALAALDDKARARMVGAATRLVGDMHDTAALRPIIDTIARLTGDAGLQPK